MKRVIIVILKLGTGDLIKQLTTVKYLPLLKLVYSVGYMSPSPHIHYYFLFQYIRMFSSVFTNDEQKLE